MAATYTFSLHHPTLRRYRELAEVMVKYPLETPFNQYDVLKIIEMVDLCECDLDIISHIEPSIIIGNVSTRAFEYWSIYDIFEAALYINLYRNIPNAIALELSTFCADEIFFAFDRCESTDFLEIEKQELLNLSEQIYQKITSLELSFSHREVNDLFLETQKIWNTTLLNSCEYIKCVQLSRCKTNMLDDTSSIKTATP